MFFGSSSIDLQIIVAFLAISFIISLIVFIAAKRKILSLLLFSILANTIFFLSVLTGSTIFRAYDVIWFSYFSFFIWPILNILFIVYYASAKPKK